MTREILSQKRLCYSLELIKTGVEFLFKTKTNKADRTFPEPIRSMIVYSLHEIDGHWLPVNRDYKPLGISHYSEYVKYEDYPYLFLKKDQVRLGAELWEHPQLSPKMYFLFQDHTFPESKKLKDRYLNVLLETFPELQREKW